MKLRIEKRIMESLDAELQGFSKTLNPEWLQWCVEESKISYGGWRVVGHLAKTILWLLEKKDLTS